MKTLRARLTSLLRGEAPLALGIGIGFLIWQAIVVARVFTPGEQFIKYPSAARLLVAGGMTTERFNDFSPFYLMLHVAAMRLFPHPETAVMVIQLLMMAGTAAFLFLLLRRFVAPPVALAGMTAFAFTPSVIVYGQMLEPEACVLFFLTGFLWLVAGRAPPRLLSAGMFLALLVLTRPTFLPLVVVPLLTGGEERGGRWRLGRTWLFAAPVLAALLYLWAPRAGLAGRLPVVMNPGQVFFEGNNPLASGQAPVYPLLVDTLQPAFSDEPDYAHAVYRIFVRRIEGADLTAAGSNRFWAAKAASFVVDYPVAGLRRLATKVLLVFHDHRACDLLPAYLDARRLRESWVPAFPFALLSALAVAGVAVSAPAWRRYLPLYVAAALQVVVMLVFYASERQRVALIPLFVVFACVGAAKMLAGRRALILLAPLVLAGTAAFTLPIAIEREDNHLWGVFDEATLAFPRAAALRSKEDLVGARRELTRILAADPLSIEQVRLAYVGFGPEGFAGGALAVGFRSAAAAAPARFDRALLLLAAGDCAGADALLGTLEQEGYRPLRRGASSATVAYYRARCDFRRGDADGARVRLEQALIETPGDPYVLAYLMALTGNQRYGAELFRYFDDIDGAYFLGQAYLETRNPVKAVDSLSYVCRIVPEFRNARVYLAAALGLQGRDDEAADLYLQTAGSGADPVLLEGMIVPIFRRRAEREQVSSQWLTEYAVVLSQYGQFEEAAAAYRRVLERFPSAEIAADLAWAEKAAWQR